MSKSTPEKITLEMMRASLYSAAVSDALDMLGFRDQSPRLPLARYSGEGVLVGRAKTTLWADMYHEDPRPYELELEAVDGCQADDVLIAACGGSLRSAVWGELLSTAASVCGCVGAIVDGAVRDVRQLQAMGFPVWARGTSVYDSLHRQRVIDLDVTVRLGEVEISPGDLVFADVDGMVVAPQAVEEEAIRLAWKKVHDENRTRQEILGGMLAGDVYRKYGVL